MMFHTFQIIVIKFYDTQYSSTKQYLNNLYNFLKLERTLLYIQFIFKQTFVA